MKKLLLSLSLIFLLAGSVVGYAQDKEKVVSASFSMLSGSAMILDEYLIDQAYTGDISAYQLKFGAMYKKNNNLTWDLYGRLYDGPKGKEGISDKFSQKGLMNPSRTTGIILKAISAGYGTYYNWSFADKLQVKAGGLLDFYGGLKEGYPSSVNNAANFEGQLMLKAAGGIKYGWDFKKNWGLNLYANLSLPVFGVFIADHKSEAALLGSVFKMVAGEGAFVTSEFKHTFFGFYHNYQAVDYELGIEFVFKPLSFGISYVQNDKWWNVYDLQNIRKYGLLSLNIGVDLVSRSKYKSSNKYF